VEALDEDGEDQLTHLHPMFISRKCRKFTLNPFLPGLIPMSRRTTTTMATNGQAKATNAHRSSTGNGMQANRINIRVIHSKEDSAMFHEAVLMAILLNRLQ